MERATNSAGFEPCDQMSFILEHQADAAALYIFRRQQGCQCFRKFIFHSSWAAGSLLGWCVSGATFLQPCRSRSLYTREVFTGLPKCCANAALITETTSMPPSLAWSSHGSRNFFSSSNGISSRRRPPQLRGGDVPVCMLCRNRACKRGTEALETPSNMAVCSRVAPMMAGNRTACAQRSSVASLWLLTACCACLTNSSSIFRGLPMLQAHHN